ncbi:hypothetical protein N9I70_00230 [Alphaproteobacteria bacterium]|nr:hypothetical protein [Alphaproteobacteria bacterium]
MGVVIFGAYIAAGKREAFEMLKFMGFMSVFSIIALSIYGYTNAQKEIKAEAEFKAKIQEAFTGKVDEATQSDIVFDRLFVIKKALNREGREVPDALSQLTTDAPTVNTVKAFESLVQDYRPKDNYLIRFGITSKTTFDVFKDEAIADQKSKCLSYRKPCSGADYQYELEKQLLYTAPDGFIIDSSSDATSFEQLKSYLLSNPTEFPSFVLWQTGRKINTIEDLEQHYINDRLKSCQKKRDWCISELGMNENYRLTYPSR